MRSSCRKEWDRKVVFSGKPSSSDSGNRLLKGASTNCNFYMAREKGEVGVRNEKNINHHLQMSPLSQTSHQKSVRRMACTIDLIQQSICLHRMFQWAHTGQDSSETHKDF